MSGLNLSSNELDRSVVDSGIYYNGDYYYEDEAPEPREIFGNPDDNDQLVYDDDDIAGAAGYPGENNVLLWEAPTDPKTKTVDPDDAVLIIAENFHTLKCRVPDADNHHLWELAKDCLLKYDSAADYASDLINTGDYPLALEQEEFERESADEDLSAALKYSSLRAILPEADTMYVWNIAKEHANSNDDVFNKFVLHLQESGDYPRSDQSALTPEQRTELKKQEMSRNVSNILHTIDSAYIQEKLNADPDISYNEEGVGQLLLSLMENAKLHPSVTEEYYRNVTEKAIQQYSSSFDVEEFLQKFPQPVIYFENPSTPGGPKYRADVYKYLRSVVMDHVTNDRLRQTLKQKVTLLKCHRSFYGDSVPLQTIQYKLTDECGRFINELTYIRFQESIKDSAAVYASLFDEKSEGAEGFYEDEAVRCELCDEQVPLTKVLQCTEAHMFCADCVRGWVNERLGQGHAVVNCLETCTGRMPDEVLSRVLPVGALDKLLRRRQVQDLAAANIDDIQNCLWCDYSYVPRNEDIDLVCLNPACGEKWCKKCRELAHQPAPCEDTPEEVKKRVYIEERMTNAMVRQCPTCKVDIHKVDGCDYVVCSCGTRLCYNCGRIAPSYHYCREQRVNRDVNAAGQAAKAEANHLYPNVNLNFDPTRLP